MLTLLLYTTLLQLYLLVQDLAENTVLHVLHLLGSLLRLLLLLAAPGPALRPHLGHPLGSDLCQLVVTHPVGCEV